MTSIKLMLTGAQAWASVTGPLTSGMVGIPITIEYDEAWDGLTKNLMCRCSPWGSTDGEYRAILNVGETAIVAHEVMQPEMYLYLGVEGYSDDGKLVIPTTWARCGKIEYGANTCEDPSTDPELSVWNQLQIEMEKTKEYVLTPEQAVNIQAYAQTATQAAQEAQQAAVEAKQVVESGLYYIPVVSQPTDNTLKFEFKPSLTGSPIPKPVTVELPEPDSSQNVSLHIGPDEPAGDDRPHYWLDTSEDEVEPEITLTGISAAYSGGDVAVGTALSALTGVVVTATYSDGSTEAVTGYTLSGEIAEDSNTITVTYVGLTATFTVTGVAESGGEEEPDVTTYSITNNLTNITSSNAATSVEENASYTATLTAADDYELDTVTVTMGGTDITATAYADGVVSIAAVTGDVVVTAEAVTESTGNEIDLSESNMFSSSTYTSSNTAVSFSSNSGTPSWDDFMTLDAEKLYFYFEPYSAYNKTLSINSRFNSSWGFESIANTVTLTQATDGTYDFITNAWDKYADGGYVVFEIDVANLQATIQAKYDSGALDASKEKIIAILPASNAVADSKLYLLYSYNG